jgi:hypothetical protein
MLGLTLVITGAGTVKVTVLLLVPPTVTLTGPVAARGGTVAVIWPSDQLVTAALNVSKVTVLDPCEDPNPLPLICTCVATGPDVGEMLEMDWA